MSETKEALRIVIKTYFLAALMMLPTANSIDQTVHQALTRKDTTQQALITAVKAQLEEVA